MATKDPTFCELCGGPVRPNYGNMCKSCACAEKRLSDDGLKAWLPKTAPASPSCELGVADDGGHIAAAFDIPGGWTRESVRITLERAAETVASLTTALAAEKGRVRKLEVDIAANRATANERILELERKNESAPDVAALAYSSKTIRKLTEQVATLEKQLCDAPSRHEVDEVKRHYDYVERCCAPSNDDASKLREEVRALRSQLALAESRRAPARHRPGPQVSVGWDPEGE